MFDLTRRAFSFPLLTNSALLSKQASRLLASYPIQLQIRRTLYSPLPSGRSDREETHKSAAPRQCTPVPDADPDPSLPACHPPLHCK
jgi:hypothetical protein